MPNSSSQREPLHATRDFHGKPRSVRVTKQRSFEELTTAACIVGKLRAPWTFERRRACIRIIARRIGSHRFCTAMTKWSQKKPVTPKRLLHKAMGGVMNGHVTKHTVKRLARKAGKLPSEGRQNATESLSDTEAQNFGSLIQDKLLPWSSLHPSDHIKQQTCTHMASLSDHAGQV